MLRDRRWLLLASIVALAACSTTPQAEPCAASECVPIQSGDIALAAELDLPPGPGPHPVLVMVHGSGPGTRHDFANVVNTYRSIGVGTLRYDKRGAGESTGRFRDVTAGNSIEVFDLLASDLLSIVEYLATQPGVDANRIGLIGVSQAGWIMPLATARSDAVAFFISISGAASTVEVSDHYDRIAEDLSSGEIAEALASFDGTHGYDPVPDLESVAVPALWIYGARDLSNPTTNDVEILNRIRTELGKDFTIHVFDNADHNLIDVTTGQPVDAQAVVKPLARRPRHVPTERTRRERILPVHGFLGHLIGAACPSRGGVHDGLNTGDEWVERAAAGARSLLVATQGRSGAQAAARRGARRPLARARGDRGDAGAVA